MTNNSIAETGQQYIMNTYGRFPISLVRGKGTYVWDADNKQYLDFVGGIAACSLGHSNENLIQVLTEQAKTLWHVSNLYWIEPQVQLAEKLTAATGMDKAFFCNSGAEANEAAIKLARKYFYGQNQSNKNEIITFKNSFHGRTLATVTATGQTKYQKGFAPLAPGFVYADYNDLPSVEAAVNENTAAILVEVIQGEGGVIPADISFLRGLRQLCDQNELLLIIDEVQTGVGRTGKFLACQLYGIKPDIVTLAKGLGGGIPIGACLAVDKVAAAFEPGNHASTFGGNPLVTAVACKVTEIVSKEGFLKQVEKMGDYLGEKLLALKDPRIVQFRSRGLIQGLEFEREVKDLVGICMKKGLLLVNAGPNVLRFVPPLTVNEIEINGAAAILKQALQEWE
ncbi:MAG TPA: aspartate aminotransferase family protein [Syntrophomonadaceae bacterium]|jgi:acetylornithine/N-succinyldiaminopimelate aminotransferase|nr:aspartate aminotransferase family protein [Syntrophomonadaceae bacterium]HRX20958.1 aspartate aminotransferase family protein [Syntrophomonadaceae bacterium]